MNLLMRKFGPLAGVVTALTWLCWEYVGGDASPLDLGGDQVLRLDSQRLDPVVPPPSARDPLLPLEPAGAAAGESSGGPAIEAAAAEAESRPPAPDPVKLAKAVRLRATFVGGRQKSALINDQLCFEGDPISAPQMETAETWTLARVELDQVVLQTADHEIHLSYDHCTVQDRASDSLSAGLPKLTALLGPLTQLFTSPGTFGVLETREPDSQPR